MLECILASEINESELYKILTADIRFLLGTVESDKFGNIGLRFQCICFCNSELNLILLFKQIIEKSCAVHINYFLQSFRFY